MRAYIWRMQAYTAASARGKLRAILTLGAPSNIGSHTGVISADVPALSGTRGANRYGNSPSTGSVSVQVPVYVCVCIPHT